MEELANLINNVARFLAFGIGGVSVIVFLYAGFLFMTASGDPQKSSQARMAIFGAFIGLVVAGAAFVLPRIISQAIIEPAGGVAIATEGQISCDELFREQLVAQRGANNAARMNEVRQLVQGRQECSPEVWDVVVAPSITAYGAEAASGTVSKCFGPDGGTNYFTLISASVGSVQVPIGLREGNTLSDSAGTGDVRKGSYRDANNNILVVFTPEDTDLAGDQAKRPADGAVCWMYVSRLRQWYSNF